MAKKVTDELLDHEYDGIREFDNPIPAWWNWLFVGSIVFSVGYYGYYHIYGAAGIFEKYEVEMAEFRKLQEQRERTMLANLSEDTLIAAMRSADQVRAGQQNFETYCAPCHGQQGEGSVGPNLTDAYWLHADGSLLAIRKVISEGVLEKGMPAWGKQFSPEEMIQLSAYVGTLRGTNREGKPPEGEKVELSALETN
ncbi:MAG: cbb3-type cytochrome c oxidase N-terminal domain-containing protein [Myxococcota bacterium]